MYLAHRIIYFKSTIIGVGYFQIVVCYNFGIPNVLSPLHYKIPFIFLFFNMKALERDANSMWSIS